MTRAIALQRIALLTLLHIACAAEPAPDEEGAFVAGHQTMTLKRGERNLEIEIWYPGEAGTVAGSEAIETYVTNPANQKRYQDLLSQPGTCATRTLKAKRAAVPAEGPWPLLLFSHCHGCTRFSSASLAEHLASHGFAVAAVDHLGNTLFDELDGTGLALDATTLRLRVDDEKAVLDALLGGADAVPEALRGRFDSTKIGAYGHSFGSVTTGLLAQEDVRIRAAAGIAAPMENALLPGVKIASIPIPLLFLVAREDNSITELGDANIRDNYDHAVGPAWKVEVEDAGHWSFSDIAGLRKETQPGCGTTTRQTDPSKTFTYLPVEDGRAIARSYLAAFFRLQLRGDERGKEFLEAAPKDERVTVDAQ